MDAAFVGVVREPPNDEQRHLAAREKHRWLSVEILFSASRNSKPRRRRYAAGGAWLNKHDWFPAINRWAIDLRPCRGFFERNSSASQR
jgi:hypothetical protein